jgi:hypothetical protein
MIGVQWGRGSREAAKGNAGGLLWCVVNCLLSSQLSRIYSLWHGCHGPSPRPLSPFHGGEGRISGQWRGSREAAKGNAQGLLWCVVNCLLSSQLSRIYSLWHGCHGPLTPHPSPVSRGRGED